MEAAGAFPLSQGSQDAKRLPIQVLEIQADKWMQGASMLQEISLKKKVREKIKEEKEKHGVTKLLQARPIVFIFKRVFYNFTCT